MPVNPITERAVFGMFYEALQQFVAQTWLEQLCTPVFRSDQPSEDYAWLGQVPQMSQLIGSRQFSQLRQVPWTVLNVPYQGGISIPLNHVMYDKTDQVMIRVNELAERSTSHWWKLVAELIIAGASSACYDDQYYFDTDHSEGSSGSQSNDITVSGLSSATAPTASEMVTAILTAINTILGFKDDKGEYCNENLTDFLVMLPLSLSIQAMSALQAPMIQGSGGAVTNILVQQDNYTLRLAPSPRLASWTSNFSVHATGGMQKPFIRQQRVPNQAPGWYDADGLGFWTLWTDSEHCKKEGEVLVNVESERAAAYGDWKKSCLVTLST